MKPIFLSGFMGCGKSTVGKILAQKLKINFIDGDSYIENKIGKSIPQIFVEDGENFFRDIEYNSAKELCLKSDLVVATGGGMMTFQRCFEAVKDSAVVVYIDTSFEECYRRIKDSNRPIVASNSKEDLERLYNARKQKYLAHSHVKCTPCKTPEQTAEIILYTITSL
jgi:shikimate kinase